MDFVGAVDTPNMDKSGSMAVEEPKMVRLDGEARPLLVHPWQANGAAPKQWGMLLQTSNPETLSIENMQRVLAAFRDGRPLHLFSCRFKEPSFSRVASLKRDIESGRAGGIVGSNMPAPCFSPNEDNVNYEAFEDDRKARDDRWLLVWQTVARQAKESGGVMVQVVDEALGLSAMQQAEEGIAQLLELRCVRVPVVAVASSSTPGRQLATFAGREAAERRLSKHPLVVPPTAATLTAQAESTADANACSAHASSGSSVGPVVTVMTITIEGEDFAAFDAADFKSRLAKKLDLTVESIEVEKVKRRGGVHTLVSSSGLRMTVRVNENGYLEQTGSGSSSDGDSSADTDLADDEITVALRRAVQPQRLPKEAINIQWVEKGSIIICIELDLPYALKLLDLERCGELKELNVTKCVLGEHRPSAARAAAAEEVTEAEYAAFAAVDQALAAIVFAPDHFAALELDASAPGVSDADVHKAFLRAARRAHPDKHIVPLGKRSRESFEGIAAASEREEALASSTPPAKPMAAIATEVAPQLGMSSSAVDEMEVGSAAATAAATEVAAAAAHKAAEEWQAKIEEARKRGEFKIGAHAAFLRVKAASEALQTAEKRAAYREQLGRRPTRQYAAPTEPWVVDAREDRKAQLVRQEAKRREEAAAKGEREMVLAAVKQNGHALRNAPAELKGEREIVLAAVKQNGNALQYASAELKGDREIVLAALEQNGGALQYASAELKGDREIVLAADRTIASMGKVSALGSAVEEPKMVRPTMVPVRANQPTAQVVLPIFEWIPSRGHEQWGLLLQTMGTALSEADMAAVLRAFCGSHRRMYVLSTRFAEPSFAAAQRAKVLIESGHTDAPLTLHEPSPCFNPNTDNINYQEVTRDEQRRDERSLLFWQTVARQAKESGGVMVQVVDEALGLSAMQQAEERIAKLLELRCVRVPVVAAEGSAKALGKRKAGEAEGLGSAGRGESSSSGARAAEAAEKPFEWPGPRDKRPFDEEAALRHCQRLYDEGHRDAASATRTTKLNDDKKEKLVGKIKAGDLAYVKEHVQKGVKDFTHHRKSMLIICAEQDPPQCDMASYLLGVGCKATAEFDGNTALDRLSAAPNLLKKPRGKVMAQFLLDNGAPTQNGRALKDMGLRLLKRDKEHANEAVSEQPDEAGDEDYREKPSKAPRKAPI